MGLRELKKAKTREAISHIALELFIEKGYAAVTVSEIAEKAQVAVSTLFNYFPSKESLIFDREDEIDTALIAVIRNRSKSQSVLDALHRYFLASEMFNPLNKKMHTEFTKLIKSSPELATYYRGIWNRYADTLAKEIQTDLKLNKTEAECVAKLLIEGVVFAGSSLSSKDALNLTFNLLKNGWNK